MKLSFRLRLPAALAALLVRCRHGAPAEVPHTVQPGETLWSIAAASNFTTRAVAAANGLPEDAQVVVGTTIQIPSEAEAAAALTAARRAAPAAPSAAAPAPRRTRRACSAHTPCRPGDTLSHIAAANGVSRRAARVDERARPGAAAADRHGAEAPDRGAAGRRRRPPRRREPQVVAGRRAAPGAGERDARRRSARSRRATASLHRSPPRSPGRRAGSRTASSRSRTRAA